MRKILISLLALALTSPVLAQSDEGEDDGYSGKTKNNAFFLGIKAGGTLTTMTQPEEGDLYDGSGFGFSAGLALKARFGNPSGASHAGSGYFGAGLELKYKLNTVKTVGTDEDGKENANLSVGYFEVPIYGQLYPLVKSPALNSLYIELGVSFAGTLSRSPKSLTMYNPNERYSEVTYYIDGNGKKLKGMDVRPLIGAGYTVPGTGLDINLRYYLGTSKLAENFDCKMNTFEFSLAWNFQIGTF